MTRMLILALDIACSSATNLNQWWSLCSISAKQSWNTHNVEIVRGNCFDDRKHLNLEA